GNRADADTLLAQVYTGQRLAIRQGQIDTRAEEVAAPQDFCEQTHLAAGATALTLDTTRWQRGFLADQRYEIITQCVEFVGDGVEEFSAAGRAQLAVFSKGF